MICKNCNEQITDACLAKVCRMIQCPNCDNTFYQDGEAGLHCGDCGWEIEDCK